jgi:hypothetical protein
LPRRAHIDARREAVVGPGTPGFSPGDLHDALLGDQLGGNKFRLAWRQQLDLADLFMPEMK